MSISGTGPVNSGSPFTKTPRSLLKATGVAGALQEKITKALSEQQSQFDQMQAAELKKRVAFYARFEGRIGEGAISDVALQAKAIVSRMTSSWVV
ncbi:MAG TPA: hypothetical protein VIN59_02910 [Alphaproteobacteria bacterium]